MVFAVLQSLSSHELQLVSEFLSVKTMLILTVRLVVEDQLHSCGDIGEDIKGEDDDDQEGPEVTEAVHDCCLSRRRG